MRVLELGSYVAPAYAGMILAEQGHDVDKWWLPIDPILTLDRGDELWDWINHGKRLTQMHASAAARVDLSEYDVVIDNIRARALANWQIEPQTLAERYDLTWVSLRDDFDERSFDAIAQARAWGDLGHLPFYIGDTAAGLWLAFKALAVKHGSHHVIRQASVLAKLVEGELVVSRDRPWDAPGEYVIDENSASVLFKGERISEPTRDAAWRRQNLHHVDGRFVI